MNSHEQVKSLMLDYIEGTLTKRKEAFVRKHLKECADCRSYLEQLSGTASRVEHMLHESAGKIEPPPMLWGKILSKTQNTQRNVAVSWWKIAIITCSAIGVLFTGTLAPVFGYEGNLLNVISSSMIHNASSELEDIMDDDLLGSLRSNEVIQSVISNTDITEDDILNLIEDKFDKREIIELCKIADKGSWSLSKIAEKRKKGFGIGRIANWAGVSVFRVPRELATPMRRLKEETLSRDEFEIETAIAGFDNDGALVTPFFRDPIQLGHHPPSIVDENGETIPEDDLIEDYARIKFKLEDGKPHPIHILKKRLPPPNHFSLSGKINNLTNKILNVTTEDGNTIDLNIINGHSDLFGSFKPGDRAIIRGILHRDGRRIIDFAKVRDGDFRHVQPRLPPPPPPHPIPSFDIPGIDNNNPVTDRTTQGKNNESNTQEYAVNESSNMDSETPADNSDVETTPTTSGNSRFVNMTVQILSADKDSIKTSEGTFSTNSTELLFILNGKRYSLGKDAPIPSKNIEVLVSGRGNDLSQLIIPEASLVAIEAIVLDCNLNTVLYPDYKKKNLKTNDYTVLLPGNLTLSPNQTIKITTLPYILDLALAIELTGKPLQPMRGIFKGHDIFSNDRKYQVIRGVTQFINEASMKPIDPSKIKPGVLVKFQPARLGDKSIALQVFVLSGENEKQKPMLVEWSRFDENKGVLVLQLVGDGQVIINGKTEIFLDEEAKLRKLSLRDLISIDLKGKYVTFIKSNRNDEINRITIHQN